METIKTYFEQLPKIAEGAGKAYQNVDKIYMYGGDSSKLQGDVMKNVTQISEALGETLGLDLKTFASSLIAGKTAAKSVKKEAEE
ncbi:MAG: hypothetical protein HUJ68_07740 [Clostridia bacterium]|nr:hypothetical protein [Clostridia bacterium]